MAKKFKSANAPMEHKYKLIWDAATEQYILQFTTPEDREKMTAIEIHGAACRTYVKAISEITENRPNGLSSKEMEQCEKIEDVLFKEAHEAAKLGKEVGITIDMYHFYEDNSWQY